VLGNLVVVRHRVVGALSASHRFFIWGTNTVNFHKEDIPAYLMKTK
jgi:hypothetical protein